MVRSRVVGVCLSCYAYGARTASAFARPLPRTLHVCTAARLPTGPQAAHSDMHTVRRWGGVGGGESSLSSSAAAGGVEVEMGQDSGEMFDVFLAPPDGVLSVLTEPPRPAGFRKARGLVHADGDWHRSVHVWLHNSKGELVLQKRSSSKDTFPGMWDVSVGGHFTAGQGSLETAIKETSEELGLSCDEDSLRFVCTVATTAKGDTPLHGSFVCNEYKDVYLLRHDGPVEELSFSPSEVEDVKLVPMDQLREALEAQDPSYIPRPDYYIKPLFEALKQAL